MSDSIPRYSIPEIERRWLVDPKNIGVLSQHPHRLIEDWYLTGTKLRLRAMQDAEGRTIYKLGKKYGKLTRFSEPITNLYLTSDEHRAFSSLPARYVKKERHSLAGGSLDRYLVPNLEFMIFEIEFANEDEASKYAPPGFVGEEVTGDPNYSGYALAAASKGR